MYVKLIDRDENAVPFAEIHDTGRASVNTGSYWFDQPPEQDRDYHQICQAEFISAFGIEAAPDRGNKVGVDVVQQWMVRYAWWFGDDGLHLVVTSGSIYILSDTGATIDRVR